MKHTGFHLVERIQLQIDRRTVEKTVRNRVQAVLHKTAGNVAGLQALQAIAQPRQLQYLERRAIQEAHINIGRLFTFGFRHAFFNKFGDRLKPLSAKGFQSKAS